MAKNYIRFDWAIKKLLRNKANFKVLEGLIESLLNKKMTIKNILESEGNKQEEEDKSNRVDLLCEDEAGDIFLFEIQTESETAFHQRMLYGTSKIITEYISSGQGYDMVRKVYSINIIYFQFGNSKDYVFHGKTEFRGLHDNSEILEATPFQKKKFSIENVSDIYPEYYIIKANDFDRWSVNSLDQWIYVLSNSEIPDNATAPGLKEAREVLDYDKLSAEEKASYYRHIKNNLVSRDNIDTAHEEGRAEGRAEGREEGRAEGREEGRMEEKLRNAKIMKEKGYPIHEIAEISGLSISDIESI